MAAKLMMVQLWSQERSLGSICSAIADKGFPKTIYTGACHVLEDESSNAAWYVTHQQELSQCFHLLTFYPAVL